MDTGAVQDAAFQEREWQIQRVAWVVLSLVVLAALSGLFGPGPLSLSHARSTDQTVQAEYYRFARLGGQATVTVTVAADAVRDGTVDVWWNTAYLDAMTVNGVVPEPDAVTAVGERLRYRFSADARAGRFAATFDLTPAGFGAKRAVVAVGDGAEGLTYRQFIYP